nr:GH92 family glycosyl hydrolase [uncultured Draconibacterium sp.]
MIPNFKKALLISIAVLLFSCAQKENANKMKQPVDFVNPYMGNISHLLVPTYPTIHLPNSMLRVYPERGDYTGVELHALPLVVTSHRGSSAFRLSPFQGSENQIRPVVNYSFDQEQITPYSYAVYLDEQQILVNFGVSHQSAAYEIEFEKNAPSYLILTSGNGALSWDGKALSGYQWIANHTKVYIYLVPDKTPEVLAQLKGGELIEAQNAEGRNACMVLKYPQGTKVLNVDYGISFIDVKQAKANMYREVALKSIDEIQAKGRAIWNNALGKIEIEGGTPDEQAVFYTSLYRCYERPVCISEDGRYYSAFDKKVHNDNGRPFYTDDWIWDSYRAHHPLRVLLDKKKEEDILNSFVRMSEQMDNFWWPTFPEITGDSRRMNSNHGVATVIDGYRKGVRNFDLEKAYEACKGAITEKTLAPWSGEPAGELDEFYKKHGYIPAIQHGEKETIPEVNSGEKRQPVAVTLGTSYDEWCLSEIAGELGKEQDAVFFKKASYNYRNLFNGKTRFFHPKDKNGKFIEPFDYKFSGGMGARDYYGENNGWTYRWDVQHNIPDLIDLMGDEEQFVKELDRTFKESLGRSKFGFYAQLPDQTGNVGQFTMANEPSLHIPYLYNYAGQPWKTQKLIRKLIKEWFRNDLMGVPGDEDGGGMSAFVVFSAMGFYPVTPGIPEYSIGSPMFKHVSVNLENGRTFEIEAHNASDENKYIQSATLNGEKLSTPWISHEAIENGGKLIFEMGPKANRAWGVE